MVFLTYLAEKVARSGNKLGIPAIRCTQPEELKGHYLSRVNQRLVDQCGDGYPDQSSGEFKYTRSLRQLAAPHPPWGRGGGGAYLEMITGP